MTQFDVHKNPNRETRAAFPFLLNVQNDLIEDLDTQVVVPLCTASRMAGKVFNGLTPIFEIGKKKYVMLTPQLAGIPKRSMGVKVDSLANRRDEIIAALDLLITGI